MTTPRPQTEATEARWYVVDKSGAATLCVDQQDAIEVARESNDLYPQHAPYSAVRLVPAQPQNPSGWRDIASAPKDGSSVLLRAKAFGSVADGYWLPSAYNGNGAWIWPYVHLNPVEWMRIPGANPAEQQEGDSIQRLADKVVIANATSNPDLYHAAVQDLLAGVRALKEGDASGEKDAAMLDWMAAEECCIESVITLDGTRYQIHWPDLAETQTECYLTPRAAISAAMQAMKGEGNHG